MSKTGYSLKHLAAALVPAVLAVSCSVGDAGDIMANDLLPTNYRVEGTVTDGEGNRLQGIRVIADRSDGGFYAADTLYTDKDGRYSKFMTVPKTDRFLLVFEDIDGAEGGGEFLTFSEYVDPLRAEMSNGYFGGSYLVTLDVSLERR
jgi:putative lipoprotein (rSAM/lipoprotein system)